MTIAKAAGLVARGEESAADIGHHCKLAIEQGHIDMLSHAVAVTGQQRRQYGLGSGHSREQVRHRDTYFHGFAVDFARYRHEAALGLDDIVIARSIADRRVATLARYRTIDDRRIYPGNRGIIQTKTVTPNAE